MTAPARPWSDLTDLERLELVRPLLATKDTYGVMAEKVGAPSRSSIAGLLTRMRAAGNLPPVVKKPAKPRRSKSDKAQAKPGAFSLTAWNARSGAHPNDFKGRAEQRAASPGIANHLITGEPLHPVCIEVPTSRRLPLTELTDKTCKWPQGDPQSADFGFCGHFTDAGPYCGFHHQIAYQPRAERSRAAA